MGKGYVGGLKKCRTKNKSRSLSTRGSKFRGRRLKNRQLKEPNQVTRNFVNVFAEDPGHIKRTVGKGRLKTGVGKKDLGAHPQKWSWRR